MGTQNPQFVPCVLRRERRSVRRIELGSTLIPMALQICGMKTSQAILRFFHTLVRSSAIARVRTNCKDSRCCGLEVGAEPTRGLSWRSARPGVVFSVTKRYPTRRSAKR